MELPSRIDSQLLYLTSRPVDLLSLLHRVISTVETSNGLLIALVGSNLRDLVSSAAQVAQLDQRRVIISPVEGPSGTDAVAWEVICSRLDRLAEEARSRSGDRKITILVDLDAVFRHCSASSEMMSVVYHLEREHASQGRLVASVLSPGSLPKSIPVEFFDAHGTWVFSGEPGRSDSAEIDRAAEQMAAESPEFRQRFLASGRDNESLSLLPRVLEDLRRGMLLVDRRFVIRHCSPRAAGLLDRQPHDIVGSSLSACIDGVDLVTVKHECTKLTPGQSAQPPFVASWRIAPGVYEPREVSIDPVRSGHQTIGYLILLSIVESVRGPRAVYQQLKAEKAGKAGTAPPEDDGNTLTEDESVSSDLHGTQITKREHEIILLILKQMTNREIADQLNVAEVTVKKHLTSVYRKLRISTRQELAVSFSRPGVNSDS